MAGNPKFGKRIRDLREAKLKTDPKFTLRQFATAVGISPTYLSKVERGEFDPPKAENIIKMATLLDADADETRSILNWKQSSRSVPPYYLTCSALCVAAQWKNSASSWIEKRKRRTEARGNDAEG